MADRKEGFVTYACPETKRGVATGISIDPATLERLAAFKLSLWCPHCASGHVVAGADVILVPAPAAAVLSKPLANFSARRV